MNRNFSVPAPCNENWNAMPAQENGRYCDSCQKVVVDFTNKTNDEISEYIKVNSGKKVCGTFKNSQLHSAKNSPPNDQIVKFLAALLLVFGMSLFSCNSIDLGDQGENTVLPESTILGALPFQPIDSTASRKDTIIDTSSEIITDNAVYTTTGIPKIDPIAPEIIETTTGDIAYPEQIDTLKIRKPKPEIVCSAGQMPKFPGGESQLLWFLQTNLRYPVTAKEEGIVYIAFVVRKNGRIDDVKLLKGIDVRCDNEALRVVKLMPNWIPGIDEGKAVDVQINLPIKFKLQ